ncbi:alpha/beta hydrolase [Actinocorallia aurea]
MTEPTTGRLRVDGAVLHYEVRGQGPLLLLVPGGAGDAASYDGIADALAAEYRVVSYDPRGMSRSPLDDPAAAQCPEQHADDAYRLIALLSPEAPARVAGCSSGAITALRLLADRPEAVVRVVAHEPPVVAVLPDEADQRAFVARVRETFDRAGLAPAIEVFAAGLRRPGEATPVAAAATALPPAARAARTMANMPYFVGRVVPAFMTSPVDVEVLAAVAHRLVLAVGTDSAGELPYRTTACLAGLLGTGLASFPGGHVGLSTHPAAFASRLLDVLGRP